MWHFARLFGFGAVAAGMIAMAGPTDVFAQKKKNQPAPMSVPATAADYAIMGKNKEVFGTVVSTSGAGQTIIFRVDSPTMEPNPKYKPPNVTNPAAPGYNSQANQQYQMLRTYQDLQRQMQRVSTARTPQQQQQAMYRIQMDMARLQMRQMNTVAKNMNNPNNQPFQIVHHMKDYEMELKEGAVLRKMFLPTEFDDTGNLKQYTDKVKSDLRGQDKTLPGYTATMDELVSGVEAKLYLNPPKAQKKADKDAKDKDADGVGNVDPPVVRMVVMTKESPAPLSTPAPDPKKKAKK